MLSDRTLKAIKDILSDKQNLEEIESNMLLLKRGYITEEQFLIRYNKFLSLRGRIQNDD